MLAETLVACATSLALGGMWLRARMVKLAQQRDMAKEEREAAAQEMADFDARFAAEQKMAAQKQAPPAPPPRPVDAAIEVAEERLRPNRGRWTPCALCGADSCIPLSAHSFYGLVVKKDGSRESAALLKRHCQICDGVYFTRALS